MTKPIDPEGRAFQKALDEFVNSDVAVDVTSWEEIFEAGWDAAVEWMKEKQKEGECTN